MRKAIIGTIALAAIATATPTYAQKAGKEVTRTGTTTASPTAVAAVPTPAPAYGVKGGKERAGTTTVSAPVVNLAQTATVYSVNPIDSQALADIRTDNFGASYSSPGDFSQLFQFFLGTDVNANGQLATIDLDSANIDFSEILLDGIAAGVLTANEWTLPLTFLMGGNHTIEVRGTVIGETGSFGGNFNVTPTNNGVPEPGTWAMMLLGFGGIGFALRRSRRKSGALMQVA